MTSKEMEARSGVPRANIRYYESEGLLTPARARNGYRDYSEADLAVLEKIKLLRRLGVPVRLCDGWAKGGAGVTELAQLVCDTADQQPKVEPTYAYADELSLKDKLTAVATRVYGAADVAFGAGVLRQLKAMEDEGFGRCPVCIAKTQYSFSDNPKALCAPTGHTLHIRQVRLSAGAGFVVAFAGDIIAMPGLPKAPAAEAIDVSEDGQIVGLF